jgi:hypothetical protein
MIMMLDDPRRIWPPRSAVALSSSATMVPDEIASKTVPPFPIVSPAEVSSAGPSLPTIDPSAPVDVTPSSRSIPPVVGPLVLVGAGGVLALAFVVVAVVVGLAVWKWGPRATPVVTVAPPVEPAPVEQIPVEEKVVDEPVVEEKVVEPAAPEPVAVPAPAPRKVARPVASTGSVLVAGDATAIVLVSENGARHTVRGSAKLEPGTYDVRATFASGTTITRADLVVVREGAAVTVRCQSDVENCFRE